MAKIPFQSADAEPLRRRREKLRHTRGRRFARAVAGILFLLALVAGYLARLAAVGLPPEWTDRIADAVSTDDYAIELDRVSFSLPAMRLHVGAARIYRRRTLRAPTADIRNVQVILRPRFKRPDVSWIKSVEIESCDVPIPPELLEPSSIEEPAAEESPFPDFPPLLVRCMHASLLGITAHAMRADLSCADDVLILENAAASFHDAREPRQRLEGTLRVDPIRYTFASDGSGSLDPNHLADLLVGIDEAGIAEEIAKFRFPNEAPSITAHYRYDPAANVRLLRVSIESGGAFYNGVPVSGFTGTIEVTGDGGWQFVRVPDLHVARPEGAVDGSLEIAVRKQLISFTVDSTIDPLRAVAMVGILEPEEELPLAFDNPVRTKAGGIYDYGMHLGTNATKIAVTAKGPGFSLLGLHFDDISGRMDLTGDLLVATNLCATSFDGDCEGWLRIGVGPDAGEEDGRVSIGGTARNILWDRLHAEITGQPRPEDGGVGKLDADGFLEAPMDDFFAGELGTAKGTVSVSLHDSQVFRIPFFTSLVGLLGSVVPYVDLLMDRDSLELRGTLADGLLDISKLDIEGTAFSIAGRGRAWTDDKSIDLTLDVHLMNRGTWLGAGIYWLVTPISKIFAIRASGTIDDPQWSSARLSSGKK